MPNNPSQNLSSALAAVHQERQALTNQQTEIGKKISHCEQQIARLHNAPISLEDYGDYLRQAIKIKADTFERSFLSQRMRDPKDRRFPHNQEPWEHFESGRAGILNGILGVNTDDNHSVGSNELCFYFGEVIHAALMRSLKKNHGPKNPWARDELMPVAERVQVIDALEQEVTELRQQKAQIYQQLKQISDSLKGQ